MFARTCAPSKVKEAVQAWRSELRAKRKLALALANGVLRGRAGSCIGQSQPLVNGHLGLWASSRHCQGATSRSCIRDVSTGFGATCLTFIYFLVQCGEHALSIPSFRRLWPHKHLRRSAPESSGSCLGLNVCDSLLFCSCRFLSRHASKQAYHKNQHI